MPPLTNYGHEEYARQRAQGASRREAALLAGYKEGPNTEKVAHKIEHFPGVKDRIRELQDRVEEGIVEKQTGVINRVLEEFAHIAFLDIGDAFDEQGAMLPIREMPEDVRRAISGIEYEDIWEGRGEERKCTGRVAKVKLSDKIAALNSIGKNLGMFQERQAQEIDIERDGIRVTIRSVLDKPAA